VRLHLDGAGVEADEGMRDRASEHDSTLGQPAARKTRALRR
jgi:hypothetical protein